MIKRKGRMPRATSSPIVFYYAGMFIDGRDAEGR